MTNFSLLTLTKVVLALNKLKKPLEDGEEIPKSVPYKEFYLTRTFMRPCLHGRAYAIFNLCISKDERNSGETWCGMEFADKVKNLQSVIRQEPMRNTKKVIAELEAYIKKNEKELEYGLNHRDDQPMTVKKATDNIERAKFYIEIYNQFL
jgi:hypothetical protein